MSTAVELDTCPGCEETAAWLAQQRREHGAHLVVRCDACGSELTAKRQPKARVRRPVELDEATRQVGSDLALYARWVARIEGRGVGVEPTIPSGALERSQPEDERGREFAAACAINRRLNGMRVGPGRTHVAVLEWFYLRRTGGTATAMGELFAELAQRFSVAADRAAWAGKPPRLARALREDRGRSLHDAACMAYALARRVDSRTDRTSNA